ncbi:MAG TPA: glycogen synthase GlgA [Firmicutes bacterium]|nr:glycogen synthase GlgA [Bacillota bacterium]
MKVLFVASECVPFAKSGGLADVIGSLPFALNDLGVDVRVILPKYKNISEQYKERMKHKAKLNVKLGWRNQYCGLEELENQGIHFYFIDNEYYFKRDSFYGYYDEGERYIYFAKAVLKALPYLDFRPDIIHLHDWQSATIPLLLKTKYGDEFFYQGIKTVLTIHNLKYQGIFPKSILTELLDLSEKYFTFEKLEFYNNVNILKGGIVYSDFLTTVSPTYANEILDPFYGERLDGLLRFYRYKLKGIINGIDYKEYNPHQDRFIYENYDVENIDKKNCNKTALQKQLGLKVSNEIPLVAIVSRLVAQKGLDLVECVLGDLLKRNMQLVVLGTGEKRYEKSFQEIARLYPEKVSANICFDENLAHKIYAGSDYLLMPSLFEPCGLSQLIALRYGTLPIVRETGGLRDTVLAYNEYTKEGNGFSFFNYNAHDMLYTLDKALSYFNRQPEFNELKIRAMNTDNSWQISACEYEKIYTNLMG